MKYGVLLCLTFCYYYSLSQSVNFAENEALLNVTVTDFNNNPRKGDIILFEGMNNQLVFTGVSDINGKFSLIVPKGDTYHIKYREYTNNEDYAQIEIPESAGRTVSQITIKLELPKTYVLNNVFFDTGKATLKSESNRALNDFYEVLFYKETLVIEIAGHTDNIGGEELNLQLSEDRANAVRNYLIRKGIDGNRLIAKGYGFSRPVADNETEEGRAQNRRTEIKIISE